MGSKELRRFYTEHGICQNCGQEFAEPGHVRCKACAEIFREWKKRSDPDKSKQKQYRKQLLDFRRANGLCLDCGKKAADGRVRCINCLRKAKEAEQVRRIKKRIRAKAIKDGIILGG